MLAAKRHTAQRGARGCLGTGVADLLPGARHEGGRRRRSLCCEKALRNHGSLIATCRRRESSGFNGEDRSLRGSQGLGLGGLKEGVVA